jgi:hypothetical protein
MISVQPYRLCNSVEFQKKLLTFPSIPELNDLVLSTMIHCHSRIATGRFVGNGVFLSNTSRFVIAENNRGMTISAILMVRQQICQHVATVFLTVIETFFVVVTVAGLPREGNC